MYTSSMEFPILLEREKERRTRVSKIRGINAREYILSVILETDIHDSPSSCPCHSLLRSLPPSSALCVHFERGYVCTICTISISRRRMRFAYHLSLSFRLPPCSQRNVLEILNELHGVYYCKLSRLIGDCSWL